MRWPVFILALAGLQAAPALAQDGQPFRVFFDWAKPELSRDAETTLTEVVAAYQRSRPSGIDIAGHTDRSGSDAVNLAASRRRAESVRAYLVAQGIPSAVLRVSAHGERDPIVPTEDGVREAQNRRVEIRFVGSIPATASFSRNAPLIDASGKTVGSVTMTETPEGATLVVDAEGLPPGIHAMHLHAVGRCDLPDFASAGPHWNPTNRRHGSQNPQGPHLGDLPEIIVGTGRARAVAQAAPGNLDADGAALVIHAQPDDDRTDPSGNSGARIACAAFNR